MPVFSHDEQMIADSVAAFCKRGEGIERVRRLRDAGQALDGETWRAAAAQGWIGLLAPEDVGGLGLSVREALVLLRALGRTVPFEPCSAAISVAHCLGRIAPESRALAALLAGDEITVPVFSQSIAGAPDALSGISATETDLAAADRFLLASHSSKGTRLLLVERDAPGLSLGIAATRDGGSVGTLTLHDVAGELLADGEAAADAARDLADMRRLCRAAELIGLAHAAFDMTLDYLGTREQFGVQIGSFQALQHRAATLFVKISSADALLFEAARAFGTPRQRIAALGAMTQAMRTALDVGKEAIQMHGAIGFTDEFHVGFFLKRAMSLAAAEGGPDGMLTAAAADPGLAGHG